MKLLSFVFLLIDFRKENPGRGVYRREGGGEAAWPDMRHVASSAMFPLSFKCFVVEREFGEERMGGAG